ncbi:mCG146815 [Mus musculus]|nr:mCG146815 [Mus musculus]
MKMLSIKWSSTSMLVLHLFSLLIPFTTTSLIRKTESILIRMSHRIWKCGLLLESIPKTSNMLEKWFPTELFFRPLQSILR